MSGRRMLVVVAVIGLAISLLYTQSFERKELPSKGTVEPGHRNVSPVVSKPRSKHVKYIEGDNVAFLSIPSIGVNTPVYYGTKLATLNNGAGQYTGTASPGELGNFATAGHRCCESNGQVYKNIDKIKIGDELKVTALGRVYHYYTIAPNFECKSKPFTASSVLVKPSQVEVLNNIPCKLSKSTRRLMTLTSCEPGNVVPSPFRVILWAEMRTG